MSRSRPFAEGYSPAFGPFAPAPPPDVQPGCADWPVDWPCDTTTLDPAKVESARQVAQHLLWAATGRRFGLCTVTRPVRLERRCGCAGPILPVLVRGQWENLSCDPCSDDCCILPLAGPVVAVGSIRVDGVPVDPAAYWWDERGVRLTDGCWPTVWACEPTVIEATWTFGLDPASAPCLAGALGELACELLAPPGQCRLPSRVVSITRQGVALDLADPSTFLDSNLFGLPLVDGCIRALNPHGLAERPVVVSPDYRR
jgi:hypothetical protein